MRPRHYTRVAGQASELASIASGQGEYGLANALWAFEARNRERAEEAWVQMAERLRAGTLRPDVTTEELHGLRKRQLISRDEFHEHWERRSAATLALFGQQEEPYPEDGHTAG